MKSPIFFLKDILQQKNKTVLPNENTDNAKLAPREKEHKIFIMTRINATYKKISHALLSRQYHPHKPNTPKQTIEKVFQTLFK